MDIKNNKITKIILVTLGVAAAGIFGTAYWLYNSSNKEIIVNNKIINKSNKEKINPEFDLMKKLQTDVNNTNTISDENKELFNKLQADKEKNNLNALKKLNNTKKINKSDEILMIRLQKNN